MPWIETLHEEEWKGDLGDMKDRVIDPTYQRVDWIFRIHSLDAGSLRLYLTHQEQILRNMHKPYHQ